MARDPAGMEGQHLLDPRSLQHSSVTSAHEEALNCADLRGKGRTIQAFLYPWGLGSCGEVSFQLRAWISWEIEMGTSIFQGAEISSCETPLVFHTRAVPEQWGLCVSS